MTPRSPGYPSVGLGQAIELVSKIHNKNRTNSIDREAAAKDMGFAGLTGSSTKALADLAHFGLIEKAGKGSIRVSQRTVDILYPISPAGKSAALRDAAFAPSLFGALQAHFRDGVPSDNAIKGFLMRQQFASAAIPSVVTSYLDTCRLVQQSAGTESHGQPEISGENERRDVGEYTQAGKREQAAPMPPAEHRPQVIPPANQRYDGVKLMSGERELTTGILSKEAGYRLIVHGKIGKKEIERLIRNLQFLEEIFADEEDKASIEAAADN
jgi:hypothetical protein